MKIRKARKEDLDQIIDIYSRGIVDENKTQYPKKSDKEVLNEVGNLKKIFKNFNKEILSKKYYWIVAESKNKILGYAWAKILDRECGWLMSGYVDREYRGKGIGKKLMRERLKWFKRNNINEIFVKVFAKNKPSLENVKSFGFKPASITFEKVTK